MALLFCTTNNHKFTLAEIAAKNHGVEIEQLSMEIDEIQSEDPKVVLEHKVRSVYSKVKKPLIVTDDSWSIPALNGFPGPYMKSINQWLTPNDWLDLMGSHKDKRIFLERRLAYINEDELIVFDDMTERRFLDQPSDKDGVAILKIIGIPDDERPVNEILAEQPEKLESGNSAWSKFFKWYTESA